MAKTKRPRECNYQAYYKGKPIYVPVDFRQMVTMRFVLLNVEWKPL